MKSVKVGEHVFFVDEDERTHSALVSKVKAEGLIDLSWMNDRGEMIDARDVFHSSQRDHVVEIEEYNSKRHGPMKIERRRAQGRFWSD